jgi:dipeptidase D
MEVFMSVIADLEPKSLWQHFDEICKIPHPSGYEKAMAQYVISFAQKNGLSYETEKSGNVLIRKPAAPGREGAKPVVLQSHLDMVCVKNSDVKIDFLKDGLELIRKGEWIKANGTSLGADNGIGVAAMLAVLEDKSLVHGPIEALFTVDEETGLNGAKSISPQLLTGKIMLNLDSEELGVFSIGCAGGADTLISFPLKYKRALGNLIVNMHLSGLRGGHSGTDIHQGFGNAIKILNRLLFQANKKIPFELVSLSGGDKHNAIPREITAQIVVPSTKFATLKKWFDKAIEEIQTEFSPVEKKISFSMTAVKEPIPKVLDLKDQNTLFSFIFALPHGVLAMSRSIKGLVETSNNVASVKFKGDTALIVCSSRSSNNDALNATRDKIAAICTLAGATYKQPIGYPGWLPNVNSEVLKVALKTFKEVTGKSAKFNAIHAGLECGLIGDKFPDMDMISIGPTVLYAHSPEECAHIGSVQTFYKYLVKMLETLI